jgi:hypothetical protein
MPGTAEALSPIFDFKKAGTFLKGGSEADIAIDATRSDAIANALRNDTPFPPGTLHLGTVAVRAAAGSSNIEFDSGKGTVAFFANGSARGGLGIYNDASDLVKDIGDDMEGLAFGNPAIHRYVALYWGYDAKAAANGSVALGFGVSAKFGVEGSSEGVYAVVRAYSNDPKARLAITDVLESWRLPRQVDGEAVLAVEGPRQLKPGTWIIAEVDGGFAATLGAQYGYDFNWIRRVGLQGLSGDLGLKIQAAVEVELGFSASGKYLLIVSRDSLDEQSKIVRVRLHKKATKGMSFALNSALAVKGSTGSFAPGQLDQLISGLFCTAAPQIIEDLKVLRQVGDPTVPLNKLAGDFLVDFARQLSQIVDARQKLTEAQSRILKFLDIWDGLGPKSSAILWDAVARGDPDFANVVNALANSDANTQQLLQAQFLRVDFFRTPIGQFLESQATTSVLSMLTNSSELVRIRDIATKVKSVLDGNVLARLTTWVQDKFGLNKIRTLALDDLDKRLKEKLSDFLSKPLDNQGLLKIRGIIGEVEAKGGQLYSQALRALNDKYAFQVNASYQKTTANDALLDISFDFGKNAGLTGALAAAIDGDFRSVLKTASDTGITINAATLTHDVARNTHVDFNLPYFSGSSDGVNEAIAKLDVRAENKGLYMFDLTAHDDRTQVRNNRNRWSSRLAVGMKLAGQAGSGIRDFGDLAKLGESMTMSYGFRRATPAMTTAMLLHQLTPLQTTYFPNEFGVTGKPALADWVTDLDKLFDVLENNGTGRLGNTLLSLDLAVPGMVLAAWTSAPSDEKDPVYLQMSRNIQAALKRLIRYCYFQDLTRYKGGNAVAAAVILYGAIPPINSIHLESGQPIADRHPAPYWDVFNRDLVQAMAHQNVISLQNFATVVSNVNSLLRAVDGLKDEARFYAPDQSGVLLGEATRGNGLNLLVESLLFIEAEVIKSAVNAGRAMAAFKAKPADGLEHLADFGHNLTAAFNAKLTDLFNAKDEPDLLRNFGVLVFVEASRALANLANVSPSAALDIAILRTNNSHGPVVFPPENFPNNDPVPAEDIGVEQRILALG